MAWLLILLLALLPACASVDHGVGEATELRVYGVAEGYVVSGPEIKRTSEGLVTCVSREKSYPCEASYAGGWEPFAAAINAVTQPVSWVITTGVALFLGRDQIPEARVAEPNLRFEGSATVEPIDRYQGM